MTNQKPRIIGFLFPIPHDQIEQLFLKKKSVFVKFGKYRFLQEGSKIKFYDSGEHCVVGEARVKSIFFEKPLIIWQKFCQEIYLNQDQYDYYVTNSPLGPRRGKFLTAFVIEEINKYSKPIKPPKRVTPAGYYLPIKSSS